MSDLKCARLFNLLADQGVAVEPFRKLIDYTPYAVEFRYTGVDSSGESGNQALASASIDRCTLSFGCATLNGRQSSVKSSRI